MDLSHWVAYLGQVTGAAALGPDFWEGGGGWGEGRSRKNPLLPQLHDYVSGMLAVGTSVADACPGLCCYASSHINEIKDKVDI